MAPIQLPFSCSGNLAYTPYPNASTQLTVPISVSGSFTSKSDDKYELVGAVTKALDFSTIGAGGAKLLYIKYEQGTAAVTLDLGTDTLELKPGGFLLYANPSPTASITAASLVTTADATLQVVALG